MGRTPGTVQVVIHAPVTNAGKQELAARLSVIHAESVIQALQKRNISAAQKQSIIKKLITIFQQQ